MSQTDMTVANGAGATVRADLQAHLQALASTSKGPAAPSTPYAGQQWIHDNATPWILKVYDGTDWITVGRINATTNAFTPVGGVSAPQGRLTLATGVPVIVSNQAAKTAILYTPYVGNQEPIYDGSSFAMTTFAELTNTTTDATKNPAAVANNSNYDLFVWSDAGTIRLGRGPAWTSNTGRGTGAGTTELERVNGILLNKVAITNGPAANRGTYVGTVRSNGTATIDFSLGGSAAGGTAAFVGIWNAYNRVSIAGLVGDTTNSWTYTTATVRPANNSTTMRASFVCGLAEDFFEAEYGSNYLNSTAAVNAAVGIGYDSTSAFSGRFGYTGHSASFPTAVYGSHRALALGFHYMQACEFSVANGTTTWQGDGGVAYLRTGLTYNWRY